MALQISKHHLQFIKLVSEGQNQSEAYRATVGNPKATIAAVKSKASKLATKYAIQIQQAREKAQSIVEAANESETAKQALKSILTQAEVDAKLCKIINGDLIEVQQLNALGKVFKASITPTINEMKSAIEVYNKRFGSNEPIKMDIAGDTNIIITRRIIHDRPSTGLPPSTD